MTSASSRFKTRAVALAIGSGLAALSQGASAVYQSPDGQGQVLIYPYYTVQSAGGNAFNTYLSVINATANAKAVKVRFREGKNGRGVLDFNLFLSPNDVWTAAVGPADASAGAPAKLITRDRSCTSPAVPADGIAFGNLAYAGSAADGGPTTLDRTREGYFEIIEMGNLVGNAIQSVTQDAAGIPVDCGFVQSSSGLAANPSAWISPPSGGLSGTYVLINVANGLSFSGNATALSQFSATTLYTNPGDPLPDLTAANPPFATTQFQSLVSTSAPGPALLMGGATYANGRDAVSAALMKYTVSNEYVLDVGTQSATDWVFTFPTKAFYVTPASASAVATTPFTNVFGPSGSCEPIFITYFNREETLPPSPGSVTPVPPGTPGPALCWSTSIMTFGGPFSLSATSRVFGSANAFASASPGFPNGWVEVGFAGVGAYSGVGSTQAGQMVNLTSGATPSPGPVLHRGLPVIGFMARTLNNGLLNCTTFGGGAGTCVGSYGALMDHRFTTNTTPTP